MQTRTLKICSLAIFILLQHAAHAMCSCPAEGKCAPFDMEYMISEYANASVATCQKADPDNAAIYARRLKETFQASDQMLERVKNQPELQKIPQEAAADMARMSKDEVARMCAEILASPTQTGSK